jgi:hypothetical protein
MPDRKSVLRVLVGLWQVNDLDLVSDKSVLSAAFPKSDPQIVLAMAKIIEQIFSGFDYRQSPEFLAKVVGKSEQFRAVLEKRYQLKGEEISQRLGESLVEILESDNAFLMMPHGYHHLLKELKDLVLSLPGE